MTQPGGPHSARRRDHARPVRDVLRSMLLRGRFAGGELPDERALAGEFGVSRNVVREALNMLRAEGLIERVQGSGTFGLSSTGTGRGSRIDAVIDSLAGSPEQVVLEVLRRDVVDAPEFVARQLGLAPRSPVVLVERRGWLRGQPVMLTLAYMPRTAAEPLVRDPTTTRQWPHIAEVEQRLGLTLHETDVVGDAVLADAGVAALLGCAAGVPLLLLERLMVDQAQRPFELSFMRLRHLRVSLVHPAGRSSEVVSPCPSPVPSPTSQEWCS